MVNVHSIPLLFLCLFVPGTALMDMCKTVLQSDDVKAAIDSFKADIAKMDRGLPIGNFA